MARPARDPHTQRAALLLLARGFTPADVARVAGVSRQLAASWARSAGVDWQRIGAAALAQAWTRALSSRPLRLPSKREQRATAARAKREWDKTHGKG